MKKIILLAFTIASGLINPLTVSAQQNKFDIGIVGGADMVFLRDFPDEGIKDYAIRFAGGLSLQQNFSSHFSLHADIIYEDKGANDKIDFTDAQGNILNVVTDHLNFNYITLPVLFRYSTKSSGYDYGGVRFFVNAGPCISYLFKVIAKVGDPPYFPNTTEDGTSFYKPLDIGATGGVGIVIPVSHHFALTAEVRDNLGLIDISRNGPNFPVKTNSTLFILSLVYHLK